MRKSEIVHCIANETAMTQAKVEEVVNAIFDEIKRALHQGDTVTLRRFGSFHVRDKHARLGRNPKTGQEVDIPPRRIVVFKSGHPFKNAVNGSAGTPARLFRNPHREV